MYVSTFYCLDNMHTQLIFLKELQAIKFCGGAKKYDFNVHSHTTAGSMALSVY